MKITGEKVYILKATVNDAELLCRWWRNPELMKAVGFPNGVKTDREKLEKQLYVQNNSGINGIASMRYIIYDKQNDMSIGELCYNNMDNRNRSCDFGIKICELSYQGYGFGYDALYTFLKYLFNIFSLHKIELTALIENKRAHGLYRKLGFKEIGIKREAWKDEYGIFHDILCMDMLEGELYPYVSKD